MRPLPADLYTCAKCCIRMIAAFRTNHPALVLCGFCVGWRPDDPPMHRPVIFNRITRSVIRYTPDELAWVVAPNGTLLPVIRYERTA